MLASRERAYLKCAALCYGFMLDLDGSTAVADAARQFGFANPCSNRTFEDLPRDTRLFVARAGRDESPGLNAALDSFVAAAVRDNRPVTLVNHATGPHAFDVMDDSRATRGVIRQVLGFPEVSLVERGRPVMTRILRLPPAPGSGRRGWQGASVPGFGSPA